MFLDEKQLTGLTNKTRNHARVRVLNAMGIMHKRRPDGSIAVLAQHVERQLDAPTRQSKAKEWKPKWEH